MQFKLAFVLQAALATAAVIPNVQERDVTGSGAELATKSVPEVEAANVSPEVEIRDVEEDSVVEKRGAKGDIAKSAGSAAVTAITKAAVNAVIGQISNIGKWDSARQAFTQQTTKKMYDDQKDKKTFPAAVCYNKGYHMSNNNNKDGLVSVKFSLGVLHTDYDCMYIKAPNAFYTDSDGGYQNLAYYYDTSRCTYDSKTGDLTCK